MAKRFDNTLGLSANALPLRAQRLNVLAANLANADTPNYLAKDVDFQKVLTSVAGVSKTLAMSTTNRAHLGNTATAAQSAETVYRIPLQPSLDGNTVDPQVEYAAFGEAAMQYQTSLNFLEGRVRSLLSAIKGE